jgi:hypothetical protein
MSFIKRSDVKNHLSAHHRTHRTEIHLTHPESQSDATGFAHEDATRDDPNVSDPVESPFDIPTPSQPETAPTVTYKSAQA